MAKLFFHYGAMNSGKSTALMQVAHNYEERGMRVLVAKPGLDTKGGGKVVSRLGVSRKVDLLISPETDLLAAVREDRRRHGPLSCVLVDEGQFLRREQVDQLMAVTVELNIPVIAYGLRTDFATHGFEGSTRLLELAHSIEEMKTICRCGRKALFNARKVNGRFVFAGNQIVIDGSEATEYVPLCASCYAAERAAAKQRSE